MVVVKNEDINEIFRTINCYPDLYEAFVSSFVWVIFDASHMIDTMEMKYSPYNCEMFIVKQINMTHHQIDEIYNIKNESKAIVKHFGYWSTKENLTVTCAEFYKRRSNIEGETLTLSIPFRDVCRDRVSCLHFEIWNDLGKMMNYTTFHSLGKDVTIIDKEADGNVVGGVYDSDDFMPTMIGPTFKITAYIYIKDDTIAEFEAATYLRPFDVKFWTGILVWLALSSATLVLIEYFIAKKIRKTKFGGYGFLYACFLPVEYVCNQGGSQKVSDNYSIRLASFMIRFAVAIIVPAYSGSIISLLTISKPKLPFTDLSTFIQDGSYKIGGAEHTISHLIFNLSTDPLMKIISARFLSEKMPRTDELGVKRLCNDGKFAFVGWNDELYKYVRGSCKIRKVPKAIFSAYVGMILRPHSPYADSFHRNFLGYYSAGIMQKMKLRFYYRELGKRQSNFQPIELMPLQPVMIIIGTGQVISAVVFVLEIFWKHSCSNVRET